MDEMTAFSAKRWQNEQKGHTENRFKKSGIVTVPSYIIT